MELEITQELIDEKDASRILGLSIHTLRTRRMNHKPPTYLKIGSIVRYRMTDLDEYLQSCVVKPQSEPALLDLQQ